VYLLVTNKNMQIL